MPTCGKRQNRDFPFTTTQMKEVLLDNYDGLTTSFQKKINKSDIRKMTRAELCSYFITRDSWRESSLPDLIKSEIVAKTDKKSSRIRASKTASPKKRSKSKSQSSPKKAIKKKTVKPTVKTTVKITSKVAKKEKKEVKKAPKKKKVSFTTKTPESETGS